MEVHPTKRDFKRDVKEHKLEVLRNDGVYRHIRMSRPESSTFRYDITTWAGYLCISGDMGTYVFARTNDMFCFFRRDDMEINAYYWGQKLEASCRRSGFREFSYEVFEKKVKDLCKIAAEDHGVSYRKLLDEVKWGVLMYADDGEAELRKQLSGFKSEDGIEFHDTWEYDFKEYSYHYVWCLYAIVHAINEFDKWEDKMKGMSKFLQEEDR